MTDTDSSFQNFDAPKRKHVQYDPTINLGHILTFIGFITAGFAGYGVIDKRVTVTEVQQIAATAASNEQSRRTDESLKELKLDIKEVQRAVNDITRIPRVVIPDKQ